ncbi:hypothetical protein FCM35_KLT20058 [Carex littledalei]|uniref:Uncharacterized protein n=1 Tax=Carex littledalei TaxID=544730 RepID=A0A833R9W6_9POAL|nr:hypothetical protein FCM35_KLT20058 [Carex littledalei]
MKKRPHSLRRGIHIKNHHRFLRPGALARIRDNQLISLSVQRSTPFVLLSPPPFVSNPLLQISKQPVLASLEREWTDQFVPRGRSYSVRRSVV